MGGKTNYGAQFIICPECGSIVEAESVDVGVGLYIKDEWCCDWCGWEMYSANDFGFITMDEVPSAPLEAYANGR